MIDINSVLDSNEQVLWRGVPSHWPFVLSSFALTFFGIAWTGLVFIFYFLPQSLVILYLPHFWIGILLIIGGPLYSLLVWRYTQYAITTKRVILESGVIGRDFRTVDFDQLANVEVNVGLVDRLFGTGSILMYTAGGAWAQPYSRRGGSVTAPSFSHIKNPYNVFKFFKKVSFDVKTDELYPNKYRPDVNPGYDTKYTGDTEQG